jgi:hypothetical protein
MQRWYAQHQLLLYDTRNEEVRVVTSAKGATVPIWSRDGKSLLLVSGNGLWLLPKLSSDPVEIAAPLFTQAQWPAYYGQVALIAQFAWSAK